MIINERIDVQMLSRINNHLKKIYHSGKYVNRITFRELYY